MLEFIAKVGLISDQLWFMGAVALLGWLYLDRRAFGQAISLVLFTLVFASFLKAYFQVPLSAAIGHKGWAFPSGHMLSSVVFWGSLAIHARRVWVWAMVCVFWIGNMAGMVYFGYHNLYDLSAAVWFGGIEVALAAYLYTQLPERYHRAICLGLTALAAGLMSTLPAIFLFHWWAVGGLLGLACGLHYQPSFDIPRHPWPFLMAITGGAAIHISMKCLTTLPAPTHAVLWAFCLVLWGTTIVPQTNGLRSGIGLPKDSQANR